MALQVWDLIVVGAGVAGCSLAYSQGKVGSAGRHSPYVPACL